MNYNSEHQPPTLPDLGNYQTRNFTRGRSALWEASWLFMQWLAVRSWLPGSWHRRLLLRLFGAKIGSGVKIKPGLKVKFPWRLTIGNDSWIGEDVWIDNLAEVAIGANVCISQGAYLCTGSHDWTSPQFDLIIKPISIHEGSWVAASSIVGPGVTIGQGAILGLGSTATRNLDSWSIYSGSPAQYVRRRMMIIAERSLTAET